MLGYSSDEIRAFPRKGKVTGSSPVIPTKFKIMTEKDKFVVQAMISFIKDLPLGLEALQGYWTEDLEEVYKDIQELEENL